MKNIEAQTKSMGDKLQSYFSGTEEYEVTFTYPWDDIWYRGVITVNAKGKSKHKNIQKKFNQIFGSKGSYIISIVYV